MNNRPHNDRPAEILLVEDDEDHMMLTREGFSASPVPVRFNWVENGEACMAYLRKQGKYAGAVTPDVILLDLNMPVMDGREVLQEVVNDPALCHLPVVILTTSASDTDVLRMYRLRCSSFLLKPVDHAQFERVSQEFCRYWFQGVLLPPELVG